MENTKNKNSFTAHDRWLAYFDILGFENLTKYTGAQGVQYLNYDYIIQYLDNYKKDYNIEMAWFSDTFLFYTNDDSFDSFKKLESFAPRFFFDMFILQIPMRGCINCGEFHADKSQNTYLGKGWIDAYKQGESQQIIGLTITKEAESKLTKYPTNNSQENNWELLKKNFWLDYYIPCRTKKGCANHLLPIYNLKTGNCNEFEIKKDGAALRKALKSMQHIADMLFHKMLDEKNTICIKEKDEKLAEIMRKYYNTFNFLSTAYPESNNVL